MSMTQSTAPRPGMFPPVATTDGGPMPSITTAELVERLMRSAHRLRRSSMKSLAPLGLTPAQERMLRSGVPWRRTVADGRVGLADGHRAAVGDQPGGRPRAGRSGASRDRPGEPAGDSGQSDRPRPVGPARHVPGARRSRRAPVRPAGRPGTGTCWPNCSTRSHRPRSDRSSSGVAQLAKSRPAGPPH